MGRSRRRSLKVYVLLVLLVFLFTAAVDTALQRDVATDDARHAAVSDARFGAQVAARDVAEAISLARTTVATAAANPALAAVFDAPAGCTLTFGGAGPFRTGHLDAVGRDGSVACSSLPPTGVTGYAGEDWVASVVAGRSLVGPVVDARTGKHVAIVVAPIAERGVLAAFLDLEALGPGLASTLGGPRRLEFLVTTADRTQVVSRSIDPSRWAAAPLADTPFGRARGGVDLPDVDGTRRFYGEAAIDDVGWKVFAGADRSSALASADRLLRRRLATSLLGLVVLLVAVLVIHRRITRPIAALSAGVRGAIGRPESEPIAASGPAEVAALADDFNALIGTARRELATASQLAAVVECSKDAIVSMTPSGTVLTWNPAAERMFGWRAEEMIGSDTSRLAPPERPLSRPYLVERVVAGEQVADDEVQLVTKDRASIDVSVSASPIVDAAGAVVGVAAVARDVTERNRAEAERRSLEERLNRSQRLESLGELAGGVAHDFNNLLGVIGSSADFVAERVGDDPEARADVAQIRAATDRAARLTRQLLIFGRRETANPEVLDLNAVVADVQSLLSRTLGEHVRQVVRPAGGLPAIRADRGQIEQVLVNLAVNARDAMPDGGTLTIETRTTELDAEHARLHPDTAPGRYVELVVSDTGTGMRPDVASRVFEPFFTTKPHGSGTGLGLATVYGIVIEAGGTVDVSSEEGTGTTFRVYLPAVDAPAPPTRRGRVVAPHRGRGETVLVVEDEPALLEVTSRMLERNGYVVLSAGTYEEALSLAAEHDFDVLLTDSVIPRMPGRELAERIKEIRPDKPALFMSGYSEGAVHRRGIVDHGAPLLQKPFNELTLLDAVRQALSSSATRNAKSSD